MTRLGLDFGTTNSAVSTVSIDGKIRTLGPFPSVGVWKNGEVTFFTEAVELLKSEDTALHVLRDLKMQLGVSDIAVGRGRESADQLSAKLISDLVGKAVPGDVELAVLSTPVKFSRERRQALVDAAAHAGLEEVRLVYEPTAALVGAIHGDDFTDGVSLIVDWGGGTLDIAIVEKRGQLFRELAVGGDAKQLGGSEIDRRLANKLIADDPALQQFIAQSDEHFDRFLEEVEEAKRELLESPFGENGDEVSIVPEWAHGDVIVTLHDSSVFSIIRDFAAEAREQITSLMAQSNIQSSELRYVVFAGGVCNSPDVRDEILKAFPKAQAMVSSNPQLLTSEGCASLAKTGFDIELACDFGVRQSDDTFCSVLPHGTRLNTKKYRTAQFVLTDVYAPEVIFEFGISRDAIEGRNAIATSSNNYSVVGTLFMPVLEREYKGQEAVADQLRLYAGVDESLTVTVHVVSQMSQEGVEDHFTGVPLAIRQL